jgi:hypothetical protein
MPQITGTESLVHRMAKGDEHHPFARPHAVLSTASIP